MTDQQLAIAAKGGSREAFGELAARFQPRLLNYLRHHCPTRNVAEDAIQEAFLAAYQAIQRFDPRWQISTWLFTIARRKAGKLSQREAKASASAEAESPVDGSRSAEQLATDRETRARIWLIARRELSQDQFTALWMYYVEGLDARQTALVLNKTYASARAILARARHNMRSHLRAWQNSDSPAEINLPASNSAPVRFAA